MAILFGLMVMRPPSEMSEWSIPGLDKIAHFGVFFILTVLLALSYYHNLGRKMLLRIIFFGILYGCGLEYLQSFDFTNRDFDFLDIIANIIGASFGATSIYFYNTMKND